MKDTKPKTLTPETDAMLAADFHHIEYDDTVPAAAYFRIVGLTRTLECERDGWRVKAVNLHKAVSTLEYIANAGISARHCEDEARKVLVLIHPENDEESARQS